MFAQNIHGFACSSPLLRVNAKFAGYGGQSQKNIGDGV